MLSAEDLAYAKIIWDYHHLNHTLHKSDCIFVLGSHDTRVAEYAANLYLQGWAPLLIFSGGSGRLTQGLWDEPEARVFAQIAEDMGVPKKHILTEEKSTNTGDNICFTKALVEKRGLSLEKFILVQQPYMERRTFAAFSKQWPGKKAVVTSPPLSFEQSITEEISQEELLHHVVGDLQRIMLYPAKGYQVPQDIPVEVKNAFDALVQRGYTKELIR